MTHITVSHDDLLCWARKNTLDRARQVKAYVRRGTLPQADGQREIAKAEALVECLESVPTEARKEYRITVDNV